MVKSESEVRVFLLADFLTDGAEEMILVKEVAWRGEFYHNFTSSNHTM